jgi:hypothetical protein
VTQDRSALGEAFAPGDRRDATAGRAERLGRGRRQDGGPGDRHRPRRRGQRQHRGAWRCCLRHPRGGARLSPRRRPVLAGVDQEHPRIRGDTRGSVDPVRETVIGRLPWAAPHRGRARRPAMASAPAPTPSRVVRVREARVAVHPAGVPGAAPGTGSEDRPGYR